MRVCLVLILVARPSPTASIFPTISGGGFPLYDEKEKEGDEM